MEKKTKHKKGKITLKDKPIDRCDIGLKVIGDKMLIQADFGNDKDTSEFRNELLDYFKPLQAKGLVGDIVVRQQRKCDYCLKPIMPDEKYKAIGENNDMCAKCCKAKGIKLK